MFCKQTLIDYLRQRSPLAYPEMTLCGHAKIS